MVAAMAFFVLNDSFVKLAAGHFPTGQLILLRGFVAILSSLALVAALGHLRSLPALANRLVIIRGLMEGLVAFTFITALANLPLANITAILQAASLIVVALAAALGIEQVGWRRWLAVGVGFVGVLLVVRPGLDGFNAYALVGLACAFIVGARDLMTRRIASDIPSPVVAVGSTIMVCLVGLLFSFTETWRPLAPLESLYLVVAGVLVAAGNYAIIVAYRDGDVSVVSALRYTVLIFALILGFVIWGDWPDRLALLGAALIVASGLYAMHRERVRRRMAREAEAAGASGAVERPRAAHAS